MRPFWQYVLNCRFNYRLSVVKPTDQEMTGIAKVVCYRGPHATPGHTGKQQGQEAGGVREWHGQESWLWLPWEGRAGWACLGLAGLGNVSGLWGIEQVVSMSGMWRWDGQGREILLPGAEPDSRGDSEYDPELTSLHVRGLLIEDLFATSRN